MKDIVPKCRYCDLEMQCGFMLDRGQGGGNTVTCWVEGVPEKSFWNGITVKGKQWGQIQTFRCTECGYLENFAKRVEENPSMFDIAPG